MAFSYSGQTLIVLEAVRQARKNGAHVIAITNSPGSRLTQVAHVVLCDSRGLATDRGERGSPRGAIEPPGRLVHGRGAMQSHGDRGQPEPDDVSGPNPTGLLVSKALDGGVSGSAARRKPGDAYDRPHAAYYRFLCKCPQLLELFCICKTTFKTVREFYC